MASPSQMRSVKSDDEEWMTSRSAAWYIVESLMEHGGSQDECDMLSGFCRLPGCCRSQPLLPATDRDKNRFYMSFKPGLRRPKG